MKSTRELGLYEKVFFLLGVGPLRSAKAAEWIRTNVPGVVIPDEVIRRLKGVPGNRQRREGMQICVEIIREAREIPGISGVHVMAYRQEELVAEIVEAAGLPPRASDRSASP